MAFSLVSVTILGLYPEINRGGALGKFQMGQISMGQRAQKSTNFHSVVEKKFRISEYTVGRVVGFSAIFNKIIRGKTQNAIKGISEKGGLPIQFSRGDYRIPNRALVAVFRSSFQPLAAGGGGGGGGGDVMRQKFPTTRDLRYEDIQLALVDRLEVGDVMGVLISALHIGN